MENKKFEIKHEFKTYPVETPLSEVQPIQEGGYDLDMVDPEVLVEFPLLEAVKSFNKKGIKTIMSSANMTDIESGEIYIDLDYNSLNEANKKIAEKFSQPYMSHGSEPVKVIKIANSVNQNTTVGDVIMTYRDILSQFEDQN